jgi:hypothetical protein
MGSRDGDMKYPMELKRHDRMPAINMPPSWPILELADGGDVIRGHLLKSDCMNADRWSHARSAQQQGRPDVFTLYRRRAGYLSALTYS